MNKTVLSIGILFLLIGASVVSSNDNFDENISDNSHILESVYGSENRFSTTWYYFWLYGPEGTGFYAFYPNGTHNFRECEGISFSGGTWTNDGRYLCCGNELGYLYNVDPETLEISLIGGGGVGLNGLAYDPLNYKLYGASSTDLYEINIDTGAQSYIGNFGLPGKTIITIAINIDGLAFIWDVLFSGNSHLWTVDLETGDATEYADMGENLCYAQDGHFDLENNILWLTAYSSTGFLAYWDDDVKELVHIGNFEGEITAFAISYGDKMPPVTNISFAPPEPNGCNGWYISNVTVILDATDESGVYRTYYRINGGDLEIYDSPFIISEEGEDILIEYYSLDNMGNFEDIKSATLDIDKTSPEITVEWDVEKIGEEEWKVTFYIEVTDVISGNERLEIYLNDYLQGILDGPGPFNWGYVINGIPLSFKFISSDIAGNQVFVVVNDTDISSFNFNKDIFTQQYPNLFKQRLLDGFLLLQKLLQLII